MQFRIEYVSSQSACAYVLARQLGSGTFVLPTEPCLAGVPIAHHFTQPRMLKPDGMPDLAIFAFQLVSPTDAAKLSVNQVVELSA